MSPSKGGVIATRNDLNSAYYGRPVTPTDILVRGIQNPDAAPLIAALSRVAGPPVAAGR